jgi:hypothetical protein
MAAGNTIQQGVDNTREAIGLALLGHTEALAHETTGGVRVHTVLAL